MTYVLRENLVLGIGNPLLDITATVNKYFLSEYNLKENDAIIATENHRNLSKELLKKYKVDYTVGGSIQNTLRIIQWVTGLPKLTSFFGTVGKDEFAKILFDKATQDGVNVRYQEIHEEPTGTCIVLITGNNRSLCTNPGGSRHFKIEHLKSAENKLLFETAEYYYMGGFFLTVSPDTLLATAKMAVTHDRHFLFNLSAPFICQNYKDNLMELIPYCDVIFGNKSEIEAIAGSIQLEGDKIEETILALTQWRKITQTKPRKVVVTQGENPVLVGNEKKIFTFPVPKLENVKIIDTNGAGDAFVGGFISQYIQGKTIEKCVSCGVWCASEIIQRIGCTFDKKVSFQQ